MNSLRGVWGVLLAVSTVGWAAASTTPRDLNDTLTVANTERAEGIRTVVIDAGHGGRDLGCLGGHHQEKELALSIALKLGDYLEDRRDDIRVLYTRDRDVFVPLHRRASMANRAQADLFISIHCNALPAAPRAHGSETYVMGLHTAERNLNVAKRENAAIRLEEGVDTNYDFDPDSPTGHIILSMFQHAFQEQSLALAQSLEQALGRREGRRSRGVLQAGFVVLKETAMPSVLVETGYLTNKAEEAYLADADGQDATAEALYDGVVEYLRKASGSQSGFRKTVANKPTDPPTTSWEHTHSAATDQQAIGYYIQLAASDSKLNTNDSRWGSLRPSIRHLREAGMHKYQYGPSETPRGARQLLAEARRAGFEDAWIVAYQGSKRLSRAEAGL